MSVKKVIANIRAPFVRMQIHRIEKDGKVFYKYKGDMYPEYLIKGNAISFIIDKAKKYCKGKGIDIGAGIYPFPGAITIENDKHQNAYKLDNFSDGSLDYIFSSHCIEHLDKWQDALKLWIRKLKSNGIFVLYLPHESMRLWNPGSPWIFYAHKWKPTYEIINEFLIENGMEIIEYNTKKDKYWSFHIVARKVNNIL